MHRATDGPRARDDLLWTVALVALAFALRAWFIWRVPLAAVWDGELYDRGARAIGRGMGYVTFMFPRRSSDTVPTAFYPVGYPAFIGALYAVFGEHLRVLHFAGAAVSAASVGVMHRIAFRFVPGVPARLGALAVALMPGQILFAGAAMTEPLFGLLITASVYWLVRSENETRAVDLVFAALFLAAATFVRPQAILLAPALPMLRPSSVARGWRGRGLAAAIVSVVALGSVLPWSVRNCARLDGCAFVSTNGGANLAIGAVTGASGTFRFLSARDGCRGVVGEVHRDRCWRREAIASIRRDPVRWIALAVPKLDHTLTYESFPVGYAREAHSLAHDDVQEARLRRWITFPWKALLVLALVALLPIGPRSRLADAARLSAGTIAVLLSTHVIFFGGDRYHIPLVPLFAVLAAGAFRDLALPFSWAFVKIRARDSAPHP